MPVPTDLSKLSNVVKNDVLKKTAYNKLVAKIDNNDANDFLLKTKYSTDKAELENKIPNVSDLATKAQLNAKILELRASDLATKNDLILLKIKYQTHLILLVNLI